MTWIFCCVYPIIIIISLTYPIVVMLKLFIFKRKNQLGETDILFKYGFFYFAYKN